MDSETRIVHCVARKGCKLQHPTTDHNSNTSPCDRLRRAADAPLSRALRSRSDPGSKGDASRSGDETIRTTPANCRATRYCSDDAVPPGRSRIRIAYHQRRRVSRETSMMITTTPTDCPLRGDEHDWLLRRSIATRTLFLSLSPSFPVSFCLSHSSDAPRRLRCSASSKRLRPRGRTGTGCGSDRETRGTEHSGSGVGPDGRVGAKGVGERDAIGRFAWVRRGTAAEHEREKWLGEEEVRREEREKEKERPLGVHENGSRQADSPRRSETPLLIPLNLRRCSSSLPSHWSDPSPHLSPSRSSARAQLALLWSLAVIPTSITCGRRGSPALHPPADCSLA